MKRARPMPLENQIAISLSRYMRPSVRMTPMNSDSDRIVGSVCSASSVKMNTTSCAATAPFAARPNVRITRLVMKMVRITISVAPKLRANSLRTVESNNIARLSPIELKLPTMDFKPLALPEAGVAGIAADALIVVLPAPGDLPQFGGVVDATLADALKGGDLERKAGRS